MIDIMVIGEKKNNKEASIDLFFLCAKKSEQKNVKRNRKCQKYTLNFFEKMASKK